MDADIENQVKTDVAIDSTGAIGTYDINAERLPETKLVNLHIRGTAAATYTVDVGAKDSSGTVQWFDNVAQYSSVSTVDDSFERSETYIRIRVTSAATAGATADLLLSSGK